MTASQSIDWNDLSHAYGVATDIPALLEQTKSFPQETSWQSEPWFSLWSALYHQGDIYSASIAAVSCIVATLRSDPSRATLGFYLLPTSIAIADHSTPVEINSAIRNDFNAAISQIGRIATDALSHITDPWVRTAAQAAIFVSQGDYSRASKLLDSDA